MTKPLFRDALAAVLAEYGDGYYEADDLVGVLEEAIAALKAAEGDD